MDRPMITKYRRKPQTLPANLYQAPRPIIASAHKIIFHVKKWLRHVT